MRARRGFTLVDVMVGFVVSTVVVAAAIQLFIALVANGARVHAHLDISTELRTIEVRMRRDIACALAAGSVEVTKAGVLHLEQIRAGKPGGGFDSEIIEYGTKEQPSGARLVRNGKALSRATLKEIKFEKMKNDELLRVSLTLVDPDRPIAVKASFIVATVPVLRARRPTDPAPEPVAD